MSLFFLQSSMYFAFNSTGTVFCAKVFARAHSADFERERQAIQSLPPHPGIAPCIASFNSPDEEHYILVMPFFPRSVFDLVQCAPDSFNMEEFAYGLLKSLRSALETMHNSETGWCHADIKPANIMLRCDLSPRDDVESTDAVLVDFGSCVKFGEKLVEGTQPFSLDLNATVATAELDNVCLASSLLQILGISIESKTRGDLRDEIRPRCNNDSSLYTELYELLGKTALE